MFTEVFNWWKIENTIGIIGVAAVSSFQFELTHVNSLLGTRNSPNICTFFSSFDAVDVCVRSAYMLLLSSKWSTERAFTIAIRDGITKLYLCYLYAFLSIFDVFIVKNSSYFLYNQQHTLETESP